MKKNNLITLFCAVLFCTAAEAQQDVQVKTMEAHENFYVIDGKHIENVVSDQVFYENIGFGIENLDKSDYYSITVPIGE